MSRADAWDAMVQAAGSMHKLAELLKVERMSLWRWKSGTQKPDGSAVNSIRSVAEKLGVASPV